MTVYVVQNQHSLDKELNELVPRFDLTPAEKFGELEFVLGPTANPFAPENIVPEMREKLASFTESDYLLLIGNPVLIGWAVAIASEMAEGRVSCLQWSGKRREYIAICADLELESEYDC